VISGNTLSRRAAVTVVATALLCAGLQASTAAQGAAAASPRALAIAATTVSAPRPTLSPTRAHPGETVTVLGSIGTRFARSVVLQRKVGTTWTNTIRKNTNSSGAYRFTFDAPPQKTYYRVAAGPVTYKKKRYATRVTPHVNVTVLARSVSMPLPKTALAGVPPTVVATAVPARSGREMFLERRVGSTWKTVGTGTQGSTGKVTFTVPIDDLGLGDGTFRARVPAVGTDPQVVSPPATLTVGAAGAITAPAAGATVSEEFPVRVKVDPAASVTGVSLFVDGHSLPAAVDKGNSVWEATVDPAELDLKRKHVSLVALVKTAKGRGLTTSMPLTIDAPGESGLGPGFRIDTVASGFVLPTSFAVIDGRRMLVTEKSGVVKLVDDGKITTVLDLRDRVMDHIDAGLVGIALDPDFTENGWFYLAYTLKPDAADENADPQGEKSVGRVARYTLANGVATKSSEHVVLGKVRGPACYDAVATPDCLPVKGWMHTVNDLLFLDDGSLLVGVGDGGGGDPGRRLVAQRLDVLAGKVLRVDPVTGRGLSGNPFFEAGAPGSNRSRVYAYGFRNPFRLTVSSAGEVFAGDVGEMSWEEINRVTPGANYGWPCYEGPDRLDNPPECADLLEARVEHTLPMLKYAHSGFLGSLTLGAFADEGVYPARLAGQLFFADYSMGQMWTTDPEAAQPESSLFAAPPGVGTPVKFATAANGNLRYADIGAGSIREIVYDPDQSSCPSGTFLTETFRNRTFTPEQSGQPWVTSCEARVPAGPSYSAPNSPNKGQGWSTRWSGRPQLAPGTYRLTARASGAVSVEVNGERVADGQTFRVEGADVNAATADVVVELTNNPDWDDDVWFPDYDWHYEVGWKRVGTAPTVKLSDVPQGVRVPASGTVSWTVSATDAEDGPVPASRTAVRVALLHYGGTEPHEHPSGNFSGATGSFALEDDHAPGRILYRITGVATDSDGTTAESPPVYACIEGGEIGPCG
jgi:glucose/arabinose dehydrogenase